MKRLFLLRHAQADPAFGHSDIERSLSAYGKSQALALGRLMDEKTYTPAICFCSEAIRTRQTLDGLTQNLNITNQKFDQTVYAGSSGDYFALIQSADDKHDSLLLVAHNPSIFDLALRLNRADETPTYTKLLRGYKPATLSVIDCTVDSWANIQLNENTLSDLLDPDEYCPN